jgi:SPP1 gp7 family putative phage head morphogenesis protein
VKPFRLPAWRKKHQQEKFRRQDRISRKAVLDLEAVMRRAVDYIVDHSSGGHFAEPNLEDMFSVSKIFYQQVIAGAFRSSQEEKTAQRGKVRLAASNIPPGLPKTLKGFEELFRDKRYWPKVMQRSDRLTERIRKAYIQKLRRKFRDLQPRIVAGEVSPQEAKEQMMEAWDASESRVQTLYRTETTKYFARTQVEFFSGDPEILGFLYDSVADRARTDICRSRHGLIFKPGSTGPKGLSENTPALHWNCRSHLIALANTPYNRTMLEDPGHDPEKHVLVPKPPGWRK